MTWLKKKDLIFFLSMIWFAFFTVHDLISYDLNLSLTCKLIWFDTTTIPVWYDLIWFKSKWFVPTTVTCLSHRDQHHSSLLRVNPPFGILLLQHVEDTNTTSLYLEQKCSFQSVSPESVPSVCKMVFQGDWAGDSSDWSSTQVSNFF